MIDLSQEQVYPPLRQLAAAERFDLACLIAQALLDVRVRTPVGDRPGETVVLDGRMLYHNAARVF